MNAINDNRLIKQLMLLERWSELLLDSDMLTERILHNIINGRVGVEYEFVAYIDDMKILPKSVLGCDEHLDTPIGHDGNSHTWELRTRPHLSLSSLRAELASLYSDAITMIAECNEVETGDVNTRYYNRDALGLHITFDILSFLDVPGGHLLLFDLSALKTSLLNTSMIYGRLGKLLSPRSRHSYAYKDNIRVKFKKANGDIIDALCYDSNTYDIPIPLFHNFIKNKLSRTDNEILLISKLATNGNEYRIIAEKNIHSILLELRQFPAYEEYIYMLPEIVRLARLCLVADILTINLTRKFSVSRYLWSSPDTMSIHPEIRSKFMFWSDFHNINFTEIITILSSMLSKSKKYKAYRRRTGKEIIDNILSHRQLNEVQYG